MTVYGKIIVKKRSGDDGSHFLLTTTSCKIGRDEDCDIRIQLNSVSRKHCQLSTQENGEVYLTSLTKTGTMLLNGAVINTKPQLLKHLDVFTVSDRSFRWEFTPESRYWSLTRRPLHQDSEETGKIVMVAKNGSDGDLEVEELKNNRRKALKIVSSKVLKKAMKNKTRVKAINGSGDPQKITILKSKKNKRNKKRKFPKSLTTASPLKKSPRLSKTEESFNFSSYKTPNVPRDVFVSPLTENQKSSLTPLSNRKVSLPIPNFDMELDTPNLRSKSPNRKSSLPNPSSEKKRKNSLPTSEEKRKNSLPTSEKKRKNSLPTSEEKRKNSLPISEKKRKNSLPTSEEKRKNSPPSSEEKRKNSPPTSEKKGKNSPPSSEKKQKNYPLRSKTNTPEVLTTTKSSQKSRESSNSKKTPLIKSKTTPPSSMPKQNGFSSKTPKANKMPKLSLTITPLSDSIMNKSSSVVKKSVKKLSKTPMPRRSLRGTPIETTKTPHLKKLSTPSSTKQTPQSIIKYTAKSRKSRISNLTSPPSLSKSPTIDKSVRSSFTDALTPLIVQLSPLNMKGSSTTKRSSDSNRSTSAKKVKSSKKISEKFSLTLRNSSKKSIPEVLGGIKRLFQSNGKTPDFSKVKGVKRLMQKGAKSPDYRNVEGVKELMEESEISEKKERNSIGGKKLKKSTTPGLKGLKRSVSTNEGKLEVNSTPISKLENEQENSSGDKKSKKSTTPISKGLKRSRSTSEGELEVNSIKRRSSERNSTSKEVNNSKNESTTSLVELNSDKSEKTINKSPIKRKSESTYQSPVKKAKNVDKTPAMQKFETKKQSLSSNVSLKRKSEHGVLRGLKRLFEKDEKTPDYTNVKGLKRLMQKKSPSADYGNVEGIRELFSQKTPENETSKSSDVNTETSEKKPLRKAKRITKSSPVKEITPRKSTRSSKKAALEKLSQASSTRSSTKKENLVKKTPKTTIPLDQTPKISSTSPKTVPTTKKMAHKAELEIISKGNDEFTPARTRKMAVKTTPEDKQKSPTPRKKNTPMASPKKVPTRISNANMEETSKEVEESTTSRTRKMAVKTTPVGKQKSPARRKKNTPMASPELRRSKRTKTTVNDTPVVTKTRGRKVKQGEKEVEVKSTVKKTRTKQKVDETIELVTPQTKGRAKRTTKATVESASTDRVTRSRRK